MHGYCGVRSAIKNMIKRIMIIIFVMVIFTSCEYADELSMQETNINYRTEMRNWVIKISNIAEQNDSDFLIIPQNCSPLFTNTGYVDGEVSIEFIESINGVGQEGITYGNDRYNIPRDTQSKEEITDLLNVGIENGLSVLSVNYCNSPNKVDDALSYDENNGYISFVSDSLSLTNTQIDTIANENKADISSLDNAANWLILLNPEIYDTKQEYIDALCETNYDVLVIDAFFYNDIMLSAEDVERIKTKDNGAQRIAISYLSIGEAEDYRYYWTDEFQNSLPEWILKENPNWVGNYSVEYWNDEWQEIIATGENSYLKKIIAAGFDGVYLDIVDGYQTFEEMMNE